VGVRVRGTSAGGATTASARPSLERVGRHLEPLATAAGEATLRQGTAMVDACPIPLFGTVSVPQNAAVELRRVRHHSRHYGASFASCPGGRCSFYADE
jgi:hypothetical protein